MADYSAEIMELERMIDRIRTIRSRTCEPKANNNPRYLALSSSVAGLTKAIANLQAEAPPYR